MTHIQLQWVNLIRETDQGEVTLTLPFTIGRASSNDLILADKEAGISRWHVSVTREDDQIVLIDQQSTNGVYIGEDKIDKTPVQDGMTFRIGAFDITLTFQHRCSNDTCRRLVDNRHRTCPWCGRFMADAVTQEALFQ